MTRLRECIIANIFRSLTREQKEAVGLLQIGTFLEYFDLMLYVHMAVLLNELFFPKTDPKTAALLAAFAFCSTYVLRPFGALVFGYIGDNIGRKPTVVLTTMLMSTSCVIMANLPTYAQIGISATWIITGCRIVQGLSSMGEIIGATIYVTEITKPPIQYPLVSLITVASSIGTFAALGIATLVTTTGLNWRIGFWVGAGIAVIGSIARTRLRETQEFVDKKKQLNELIDRKQKTHNDQEKDLIIKKIKQGERLSKKTLLSFFLVYCGMPLSFYLSFMYFNPILTEKFGYTSEDIIYHNFLLSIGVCFFNVLFTYLSYWIYPFKLIRIRVYILIGLTLLIPYIIAHATNPADLLILQSLLMIFNLGSLPAESILVSHFPILKRFTATSFLYALSRSVMYIIISFGLVFLTDSFSHYGIWIIMFPVIFAFLYGVKHFEDLDNTPLKDNGFSKQRYLNIFNKLSLKDVEIHHNKPVREL